MVVFLDLVKTLAVFCQTCRFLLSFGAQVCGVRARVVDFLFPTCVTPFADGVHDFPPGSAANSEGASGKVCKQPGEPSGEQQSHSDKSCEYTAKLNRETLSRHSSSVRRLLLLDLTKPTWRLSACAQEVCTMHPTTLQ